jgi:hypothetical protein
VAERPWSDGPALRQRASQLRIFPFNAAANKAREERGFGACSTALLLLTLGESYQGIAPWRTFLGGTADMTFSRRGWTLKEPYAGSAIRRRPAAGRGCSCARVATVTKTPAPTKAPIAMCLKVIALRSLGIHQPTDLALRVRMDLPSFVGNTETMRNSCHRGSTGPAYDG